MVLVIRTVDGRRIETQGTVTVFDNGAGELWFQYRDARTDLIGHVAVKNVIGIMTEGL